MILVFDSETTGPKPETAELGSLGVVLLDQDLTTVDEIEVLYKPSIPMPEGATRVHGLRDEDLEGCKHLSEDAAFVTELFSLADYNVAHNHRYDFTILSRDIPGLVPYRERAFCSMLRSAPILRIPKPWGGRKSNQSDPWKWPSLDELAEFLGVSLEERASKELHGALVDCRILANCLREMRRRYPELVPF